MWYNVNLFFKLNTLTILCAFPLCLESNEPLTGTFRRSRHARGQKVWSLLTLEEFVRLLDALCPLRKPNALIYFLLCSCSLLARIQRSFLSIFSNKEGVGIRRKVRVGIIFVFPLLKNTWECSSIPLFESHTPSYFHGGELYNFLIF